MKSQFSRHLPLFRGTPAGGSFGRACVFFSTFLFCASLAGNAQKVDVDSGLIAHEWGTFTSVQGADGIQIEWNPLSVSDLPKFVYDRNRPDASRGLGQPALPPTKLGFVTLQRLETPVIYFYSDKPADLSVNVTESGSTAVAVQGRDLSSSSSGVGAITDSGVTTLADVDLTDITAAIENVATFRAENGAEQSHLGFAAELLTINKANLEAASSRITDVDVADESTQLARWNILVQSGTAMLAQANQSAQSALRLIG